MSPLHAPRFDTPVDIEANIALLPPKAAARGLFYADVVQRVRTFAPAVDLASVARVPSRRYLAFLEYPYGELLRLLAAAAGVIYTNVPLGEGLRRLGHHAYDALLDSHAGRVVFGVLGLDVEQVMLHGPKGWKLALNFGSVTAERLGDRHVALRFEGMPAFLETYQVGVVEGALSKCHARGEVRIAMTDLANATIDVTWR